MILHGSSVYPGNVVLGASSVPEIRRLYLSNEIQLVSLHDLIDLNRQKYLFFTALFELFFIKEFLTKAGNQVKMCKT